MGKCFGLSCFCCGSKGRASIPDPQKLPTEQQTRPSPATQAASSQETPPPSLSFDEVKDQLKAVNDASNVDQLIKIIQDILQWRTAGKSREYKGESFVATRFIDSGATFLKFFNDHTEKISNKGDFVNSAPRIIGDVLLQLGKVHWLVAGLSVIGYMLRTAEEMSGNYKRCMDLLEKLVELLDHVKKLNYLLQNEEDKLNRATVVIVKACIACASQLSSHQLFRFWNASVNTEALNSLSKEIDNLRQDLILTTTEHILTTVEHISTTVEQRIVFHPQTRLAYPDHAVGLAKGQEEVTNLLQLTSLTRRQLLWLFTASGEYGKQLWRKPLLLQ